ncbi:MAG: hypothetical protein IT198_03255, partial [Acidimicrobiia bacterium]|nr:hypothetical protein [Acidimicrobiia bacterium]
VETDEVETDEVETDEVETDEVETDTPAAAVDEDDPVDEEPARAEEE